MSGALYERPVKTATPYRRNAPKSDETLRVSDERRGDPSRKPATFASIRRRMRRKIHFHRTIFTPQETSK
jgi:hypothetical protein